MRNPLKVVTVLLISVTANAQTKNQQENNSGKINYSIFWGLIKSKEDPNNKNKEIEQRKIGLPNKIILNTLDTTQFEEKSILWGAVQWTERKNKSLTAKTSKNEK